jgi:hypothetical protein
VACERHKLGERTVHYLGGSLAVGLNESKRAAIGVGARVIAECLHYTLTIGPDVALLGLSFPNEQDAAFEALGSFRVLTQEQMEKTRRRAAQAIECKGPCWWNPAP